MVVWSSISNCDYFQSIVIAISAKNVISIDYITYLK
jgi:hypothetical protein